MPFRRWLSRLLPRPDPPQQQATTNQQHTPSTDTESIHSGPSSSHSDRPEECPQPDSPRSSTVSTSSWYSTRDTFWAAPPPCHPDPRPIGSMSINRGRFPALPPWWEFQRTPSPQPEESNTAAQPTLPSSSRSRSGSISPPRDYVPPPRDHALPPPTIQIPEPPAGLAERQAIVDGYIANLRQDRNDTDMDFSLLHEAAAIMIKQLRAQREWLNPNARLALSLPSWPVNETANAQDHLLGRIRYTGWVRRGAEMQPQEWRNGVYIAGPGEAARREALWRRQEVSPF